MLREHERTKLVNNVFQSFDPWELGDISVQRGADEASRQESLAREQLNQALENRKAAEDRQNELSKAIEETKALLAQIADDPYPSSTAKK